MNQRPIPTKDDWHKGHHPPKYQKDECEIIVCPKCGKLGCVSWWVDLGTNQVLDALSKTPVYKVIRVAHSHFLKPSFEQRRNYNHVLRNKRKRINPATEGKWSFRLTSVKIPKHILEEFE